MDINHISLQGQFFSIRPWQTMHSWSLFVHRGIVMQEFLMLQHTKANFLAKAWGKTAYGCEGQLSSASVHFVSHLSKVLLINCGPDQNKVVTENKWIHTLFTCLDWLLRMQDVKAPQCYQLLPALHQTFQAVSWSQTNFQCWNQTMIVLLVLWCTVISNVWCEGGQDSFSAFSCLDVWIKINLV